MTDVLSLGPVLDLIERWQRGEKQWHSRSQAETALLAVDVAATRQLVEQHAAQLRRYHVWMLADFDAPREALKNAADFLDGGPVSPQDS
jgi:hypothetical protein